MVKSIWFNESFFLNESGHSGTLLFCFVLFCLIISFLYLSFHPRGEICWLASPSEGISQMCRSLSLPMSLLVSASSPPLNQCCCELGLCDLQENLSFTIYCPGNQFGWATWYEITPLFNLSTPKFRPLWFSLFTSLLSGDLREVQGKSP